jgi:hypothetical protein
VWVVQKLDGYCEVGTDHRPKHWKEDYDQKNNNLWCWNRLSLACRGVSGSNPARENGYPSLMSVVCRQEEVSETGPSLFQRSSTKCCVSWPWSRNRNNEDALAHCSCTAIKIKLKKGYSGLLLHCLLVNYQQIKLNFITKKFLVRTLVWSFQRSVHPEILSVAPVPSTS